MEVNGVVVSSSQDLKKMIQEVLREELKNAKIDGASVPDVELLTRKQAAAMLQVNLSTLHLYCKSGILKTYGIGRRVFLKKHEVIDALVELNN